MYSLFERTATRNTFAVGLGNQNVLLVFNWDRLTLLIEVFDVVAQFPNPPVNHTGLHLHAKCLLEPFGHCLVGDVYAQIPQPIFENIGDFIGRQAELLVQWLEQRLRLCTQAVNVPVDIEIAIDTTVNAATLLLGASNDLMIVSGDLLPTVSITSGCDKVLLTGVPQFHQRRN